MSLGNKLAGWFGRGRNEAAGFQQNDTKKAAPREMRRSAPGSLAISAPFPHFRAMAGDQPGPDAESAFTRTRLKLLESFTPSQPVSDRRRFAGRVDVLTSVIRAIEEQKLHVVVYGERGLGKTSIMHVLTQAARDARYLVVYLSCGADSNFDEVFRTVAGYIPMLFHSTVGPTSREVERGETLAKILPNTTISPRIASDILAKIVGTRVVIVLDEFDRCQSEEFRQNVAELIKNLSDRLVRVQLVIAGVASNLTELLQHIPSIQRNIFALQVSWMSPAEVVLLVKSGGELCGLTFDDSATQAIVAAAHGSPYLATLLGHHAGLKALDEERVRVRDTDVMTSMASAAQEFEERMSGRARSLLKGYVRSDKLATLGLVAGASLLSNGHFRTNDLLSSTVGAEIIHQCKENIAELVRVGLLIESNLEDVRSYQFSEDGIAAYFWLLSVEAKLRVAPTTSVGTDVALSNADIVNWRESTSSLRKTPTKSPP